MRIKARMVPGTTADDIAKAERITPEQLRALIHRTIEMARTEVVKETPVGHSGALRGGYGTELRGSRTKPVGALVNPILYHDVRDRGRLPGRMPPPDALVPWVGSKLGIPPGPEREGIAYVVARKIGAVGYEGADMVSIGWVRTARRIKPDLRKLGVRLAGTISG